MHFSFALSLTLISCYGTSPLVDLQQERLSIHCVSQAYDSCCSGVKDRLRKLLNLDSARSAAIEECIDTLNNLLGKLEEAFSALEEDANGNVCWDAVNVHACIDAMRILFAELPAASRYPVPEQLMTPFFFTVILPYAYQPLEDVSTRVGATVQSIVCHTIITITSVSSDGRC